MSLIERKQHRDILKGCLTHCIRTSWLCQDSLAINRVIDSIEDINKPEAMIEISNPIQEQQGMVLFLCILHRVTKQRRRYSLFTMLCHRDNAADTCCKQACGTNTKCACINMATAQQRISQEGTS